MQKTATVAFPIHTLIAERWSPRVFSERPVSAEVVGSLLEAARWAPSCFNEQPWVFLVAVGDDAEGFERLAACLVEGNAWARRAPLLLLSVAKTTFERNGKPNRHAFHDVGLAVGNLVLQAQASGLAVHQMGGFDLEKARSSLGLPADHEPVAMIAVGYPGSPEGLPGAMAERETAPRERKLLGAIAFGASWGAKLGIPAGTS